MSSALRQQIGPTKARLVGYCLELARPDTNLQDGESLDEGISRLNDLRRNLIFQADRVEKASAVLDTKNAAWGAVINSIEDDADRSAETKLYERTAGGDDGFMAVWQTAQEKLSLLNTWKMEVAETIDEWRRERQQQLQPAPATSPIFHPNISAAPPAVSTVQHVRLPKLQLSPYDGNPLTWQTFWDAFTSCVDQQPIPNIEKFNYLRSFLRGMALQAIEGLAVNDANYTDATSLLQRRFGAPHIVKDRLYNDLKGLRIVQPNRTADLRQFVDSVEKIFRQLSTMGENINHPSIVNEVLAKLPRSVILKLEEQYRGDDQIGVWTTDQLRTSLSKMVSVQERVDRLSQLPNQGLQQPPSQPRGGPRHPPVSSNDNSNGGTPPRGSADMFAVQTNVASDRRQRFRGKPHPHRQNNQQHSTTFSPPAAPTAAVAKQQQPTKPKSPCVFCGGTHFNAACDKVITLPGRRKKLIELSRCFICLRSGCRSQTCPNRQRVCYYCKKVGEHAQPLCPTLFTGQCNSVAAVGSSAGSGTADTPVNTVTDEPPQANNTATADVNVGNVCSVSANDTTKGAHLLTALTHVAADSDKAATVLARVFLDCGSQRTFITSSLVKRLGLQPIAKEKLSIRTFGSPKASVVNTPVVAVRLYGKDGTQSVIKAHSMPKLTGHMQKGLLSTDDKEHLRHLPPHCLAEPLVDEPQQFEPDILLGDDYFWDFIDTTAKKKLPSGLYLLPSKLGLLLGGQCTETTATSVCTAFVSPIFTEPRLEDFWALESIGITDSPALNDDDHALEQFNNTVSFDNGRYSVGWPWKADNPNLPDNYGMAFGRFKSLANRLQRDAELLRKYDLVIQDQVRKGIIETVPINEELSNRRLHYLPHHPVITPQKETTKVRVVYDASAKVTPLANSLNDCLYRGPVILPDLAGCLLRFRLSPVAMVADIEKAFLQIALHAPDRDVTRFFWFKDSSKAQLQNNVQIYRFCRVTFGVISSPFLLAATVRFHLQQESSPTGQQISENIYVDNVLLGADSPSTAMEIRTESKRIFNTANMNLREWASNSEEVRASLPPEDKAKSDDIKVLGLVWHTTTDMLQLPKPKLIETTDQAITKRHVLQSIASVYDPLGFFAPVVLQGKLLLQRLWALNLGWDDPLPKELLPAWMDVRQSLLRTHNDSLQRHVGTSGGNGSKVNLITFVDASGKAYATVVYLRIEDTSTGIVNTSLLYAKTRVAPKSTSLPRLELLGLLIGVRASAFVKKQMKLTTDIYLFSDSECVLQWLTSKKPLTVFVSNRLKEVKSHSDIHFRYVSTKENPADCASRGITANELKKHSLWWNGPDWMKLPLEQWPLKNLPSITPTLLQEIQSEAKKNTFYETPTMVAMVTPPIIDVQRFSHLRRLMGTATYVLRFIKMKIWNKLSLTLRSKMSPFFARLNSTGPLTASDLTIAKTFVVRHIQQQSDADVFNSLKTSQPNNLVTSLQLYIDDVGLLRCRGRLDHAQLTYDEKRPIFLPAWHPFTSLVVRDVHQLHHHCGPLQTLAAVRREFWIPKGRAAVNKILRECITCRRFNGPPCQLPPMPSLPKDRVTPAKPFEFAGLDYFGPLTIKVGQEQRKAWVCLFTCLVTRAIHLEPVYDMTTTSFLSCLRRFIARRGQPKRFVSDNAPQFKLAKETIDNVWANVITDLDVINYCTSRTIEWNFITEYAPWQGGVYERMVGITKASLRKAIGRRMLDLNQLATLLCEAEAVVNSRPLTSLIDDIRSMDILRPVDFLQPAGEVGSPSIAGNNDDNDDDYSPSVTSSQKLVKFWKSSQQCLDNFWRLWHNDYLLSLRERYDYKHPTPRCIYKGHLREGTLVLIHDDVLSRAVWKMGRIQKLIPSQDGQIRSAEVALPNKKVLKRPINLLCPMEVEDNKEQIDAPKEGNKESSEEQQGQPPTTSPTATVREVKRPGLRPQKVLRTPTRLLQTAFQMAMLCLLLSITEATPCKKSLKTMQRVWSPKCSSDGYGVYKNEVGNYCWAKLHCQEGKHLDGNGKCVEACPCPKWATDCEHGRPLQQLPPTTDDVLVAGQPKVCSFVPTANCDRRPTKIILPRIQLWNGSSFYVNELTIRREQKVRTAPECIGHGNKTSGTPTYCLTHDCQSPATRFCRLPEEETIIYSNEDGEIPIRAYGEAMTTVYLEKKSTNQLPADSTSHANCLKGGIQLILPSGVQMAEICSQPICYKLPFPQQETQLFLPPEVVLTDYDVNVKVWIRGQLLRDWSITCPAAPFCESIPCTLCWTRIANPQCATATWWIIAIVGFYLGILCIGTTLKALRLLGTLLHFLGRCLWILGKGCTSLFQWMCRLKPSTCDTKSTRRIGSRSTAHRAKLPYFLAILALSLVCNIHGCSQVATITAKTSSCYLLKSGAAECTINEVSRLVLSPQGQKTCLLLKNIQGDPLGTLSIVVSKATLACQPKTEYYTRSFEMKHRAVKRCPTAGSCNSPNKCGDINTQSKVDELKGEPNNRPGFTYCAESSGGPFYGCFWVKYACLYYRTFAVPTSTTDYEVFTCPTWRYQITAEVQLQQNGTTENHKMKLTPGISTKWGKMKLTLISVTTPQVPQLNTHFLTDGKTTAAVPASSRGAPVVGTVGALQCRSLSAATTFDCNFPSHICDCQPGDSAVACTCTHGRLDPFFESEEYLLPLATTDYTLIGEAKKIELEYQQQAVLNLQIDIRGLRLSTQIDRSSCVIKPEEFKGCYSCLTGAKLKFNCQTDFGEATAHVTCGQASFSSSCSTAGTDEKTQLHFTKPRIDELCEVTCPAGRSHFHLKGSLVFVESRLLFNSTTQVQLGNNHNETSFNFGLDILSGITNWLNNAWVHILYLAAALLIGLLMLPFVPVLLQLGMWMSGRLIWWILSKGNELGQLPFWRKKLN